MALPHLVLDSANYRDLGHTARSLLIDIARQYNSHNNGKLVACQKYLKPLGWRSADVISRAKRELLDSHLLVETRMGWRPNKAAWYALAWFDLDVDTGLDIDPKGFKKGAYINAATPRNGARNPITAPSYGVGHPILAP